MVQVLNGLSLERTDFRGGGVVTHSSSTRVAREWLYGESPAVLFFCRRWVRVQGSTYVLLAAYRMYCGAMSYGERGAWLVARFSRAYCSNGIVCLAHHPHLYRRTLNKK